MDRPLSIVKELQPDFVVCENVKGLRSMLGGAVEKKIADDYRVRWGHTPKGSDGDAPQGAAWHYKCFDQTPAYAEAEAKAKEARIGLWKDNNPINPYVWRKHPPK